jgi:spore maturation protein CgeB
VTRSLVVFGLSISSSWGNGHASTFRGLFRALAARGWQITFFEHDVEWYRSNRDLSAPDFCDLRLYADWPAVRQEAHAAACRADAVMFGSLVADGAAIIGSLATHDRPLFFYDIDTPITLVGLRLTRRTDYLRADQVPLFEVYFSFAGGPALTELEGIWGAQRAQALYCGVDTTVYRPAAPDPRFTSTFGYMGTYAADRQPALEELFLRPARKRPAERFILAGPQYPPTDLPANVTQITHVYPGDHAAFYCSSRATLNLTRRAMRANGWAPSTRLFEAAACGACIISDNWPGLMNLLEPDKEVLLAEHGQDVVRHLSTLSPENQIRIGAAARARILRDHTYDRRAEQVEFAIERAIANGMALQQRKMQWANAS